MFAYVLVLHVIDHEIIKITFSFQSPHYAVSLSLWLTAELNCNCAAHSWKPWSVFPVGALRKSLCNPWNLWNSKNKPEDITLSGFLRILAMIHNHLSSPLWNYGKHSRAWISWFCALLKQVLMQYYCSNIYKVQYK